MTRLLLLVAAAAILISATNAGAQTSGPHEVFDRVTHGYATSEGEVKIHYASLGSGPLVVMIHGFPDFWYSWRHQMAALADRYQVVAIDQRGYNLSDKPKGVESYDMALLVGDVAAVVRHLGRDRATIVGHDWGGIVAWHVAINYPERLRSLTAVSVPHPAAFADALNDESTDQRQRSSYVDIFRKVGEGENRFIADDAAGLRRLYGSNGASPDAAEEYLSVLTQPGAITAALNWYRATSFWDGGDKGPVTVPTLYVWSDGDVALGPDAARLTADHVTGPYRFEALEGVSHWIPETASDRLNELLLAHLDSFS